MAPTDTYNTLTSRFKKPNKQSQTYRESQQQVIPRVAPTLTAADVEKEKTGSNGDVVKLADQKPEQPQQTTMPDLSKSSGMQSALQGPGKLKGVEGIDTSPKNLKEWFGWYDEYRRRMGLETDADREKREKKEKAERIIAAIGDGISALSQIHAASNGAVVNPGTGSTLAEGVAKRHERLRRERDAHENKVLGLLRQRKQDELAEKKARRDEERMRQAEKKANEQAKQNEALRQKWVSETENTAYKLETDRKYKEGILDLKEEEQEINRKYKEGLITARDAQIQLGYARLRASQQPTTSHTVRTDKDGNYAGESTTVRTKGSGGSGKSSGTNRNNQQGKTKTKTRTRI